MKRYYVVIPSLDPADAAIPGRVMTATSCCRPRAEELMAILDWFKNRPSPLDVDRRSAETIMRAIDRAVTLTNPRLKFLPSYQERLGPAVEASIAYLRALTLSLPPPIEVAAARWAGEPLLRAFFAAAPDIPDILGRSHNLRTLFDKFPGLDAASFVLAATMSKRLVFGLSLQGDVMQRDHAQTAVTFSDHQARICGHEDAEVRHLLATQAFEYLVAQALAEIGAERSERRELEENRTLVRARLRLLQQQGPGLGSLFAAAPANSGAEQELAARLLDNEHEFEAMGSAQSVLEAELEVLREVLEHPERYLRIEARQLRLSTMNIVVDATNGDVAADVSFSLAELMGEPHLQRAFVLARVARSELPAVKMNFADAARYL